jgi:large subunit ribosomal protein L7/L12
MADDQVQEEVQEAAEEATAEAPVEETVETPAEESSVEAPVEETKAEEPVKASKPVSGSLEKIIEQIEKLSVLELADLVHALEDRFGVSASAPVAVAAAGAGAAGNGEPAEEKTTFNVVLTAAGANKISVIKAVREIVPTLGLKEAKDLVEAAPKPVLEGVNKATAEEAKTKLTAAGGSVELQ